MSTFGLLAQKLLGMFGPYWESAQGDALTEVRDYLADTDANPVLRMWADAGPDPVIQSTTIGILRRLAADAESEDGFGYTGTIEIVYAPGTEAELERLLPELRGADSGEVGGATVELTEWDGENLTDVVNLGFTGSAASGPGSAPPDFATRIGVRYLLRLAPYLWGEPHQVQIPAADPVDLTNPEVPGAGTLRQRAYFTPVPIPEPDWDLFADGPYATAAAIIKLLTTSDLAGIGVLPADGISSVPVPDVAPPAVERMFEVVTAVLASQRDEDNEPVDSARGIAILSCGTFGDDIDVQAMVTLMRGGYCAQEEKYAALLDEDEAATEPSARVAASLAAVLKSREFRAEWLELAEAGSRVEFLWEPTEAEVDDWLDWLGDGSGHVLFVQLGTIPEDLFAWCLAQAAWPPVITGAYEASLALNLGTAYYLMARPGSQGTQYPPGVVCYDLFGDDKPYRPRLYPTAIGRQVQDAAEQLSAPLWTWDPEPGRNPAELAGGLARDYLAEDDDGPLHAYFGSVAAIYAGGVADKLSAGIAALRYVQTGREDATERAGAGEPTVLQELLAAIGENTTGSLINLVPGVFGDDSAIAAFYTEFLDGAPVVIAGADVLADTDPPTRITVTGTTVFQLVPLTAEIVFTAPEGIVIASARYTCTQQWLIDQIPWISFGTPLITLVTPDQLLAPAGSVGGVVSGTTADLAFRLPVPEGHWLLAADFATGHFDLEDFFTVAGGVDLVRSLPAPISGLTEIGIVNGQLLYDNQAEEVAFAGFRLARPEPFTLMPGITVTDLTADVVVQGPADLARRRTDWVVRGNFAVGSGVVAIAATGPELDFTGALISGVIELDQLVNAFSPGVDIGDVPSLGAVTAFSASLTPSTGDYDVSCQLDTSWEVGSTSGVYLTIESLGFTATSLSGVVTGQVDGSVLLAGTVPLSLTANYGGEQAGWTFLATQPPGEMLPLTALLEQFTGWEVEAEYSIADLGLTVAPKEGSWEVSGRTEPKWIVPFISDLSVHADFRAGSRAGASFGRIQTLWDWHGAEITVFYDYDEDVSRFGIEWAGLTGLLTQKGSDYVVTLTLSDTITLGSMIETMVTWATGSAFALEAPWSVLNSVRLSGLALEFTFNGGKGATNKVQFAIDVGPVELGFGRIDSIAVTYDDEAERKVSVTLEGSFLWNTGGGAVGTPGKLGPWDASEPGATPAPPGTGGKYVDVRMLALGQKVTSLPVAAATNVPAAIDAMSRLPEPSGDTIPDVTFDPVAGWIVGADLGFVRFGPDDGGDAEDSGYLVTAQLVFNDPRLYALRLALAGPAAKVFAGLDFQIAYRQVSDSVGVYQGELALPAAMRHLNIGGYSITLPVFAVSVYTNGDFQVDVGFPWGGDFSRSLTVEAIIAPGVPVIGSGGFYFGKLSSATSDLVPAISNGTFNPVLTFGLGVQVGFGKSVEYGPLKAGFSVTAAGIVEGVLATFCPYQPPSGPSAAPAQLQESYYFWLRGTFGIAGRLYGSVDFSVVKAEVDVSFTLMLQITYEAYAALSMTVIVAVDVSVTVRIDVGLFTIRISMSFSARIRETLTIDNGGSPPWIATGPAASRLATQRRRHVHLREPSAAALAAAADDGKWRKLQPVPAVEKINLYGTIAPAMTAARDENNPASQLGCLLYLSFIKSVPPTAGTLAEAIASAETAADTSFELFAMMVLRWAISTTLPAPITWPKLDEEIVRESDLTFLLDVVLRSDDANPAPISPADIDFFMDGQFKFEFAEAPTTPDTGDLTIFPMPPSIGLRISKYGAMPEVEYQLSGYNSINEAGLAGLRAYFDQLAVLVRDQQPGVAAADPGAVPVSLSMAQWVQSDYFLLVARQMVQAALDALRDYKYVLQATQTMGQIVTAINSGGALTGDDAVTVADLFAANSTRTLVTNARLFTGASVRTPSAGGVSFEAIATGVLGSSVTATGLAQANATKAGLLKPGAVVVYGGQPPYPVTSGDTLVSVAWHFGARFCELLSGAAGLLSDPGLLAGNAELDVPLMTYQAQSTSSFKTIAGLEAYSATGSAFTAEKLALQNAGCPILRAGETVSYQQASYVIQPGDTLADAARVLGAGSVAGFLAGNPLLVSQRVLADVAIVALPPFEYTVAPDETLAGIAARMATTVAVLAMAPLNAGAALFAKTDTQPWLDVPHLPKYRVDRLIEEVRRTLGIHKLASMVSRYAMYGTRLPTTGIVPNALGIWVTKAPSGGWTLPPMAGLYALTGQQVGVPALLPDQVLTVALYRPNVTPSVWYHFPQGYAQLTFILKANTDDGKRFASILAEIGKPVPPDIGMEYLGAGEMVSSSPASYPLTVVANWQSPAPVRLPYGKPPGDGTVNAMRLWTLPGALTSLPDPRTQEKVAPRFAVSVAGYDEATGATVTTPVTSHGWASVIEFTVSRVPAVPGSPSTETSYEIAGAGGSDVVVLERIVAELGSDAGAFDRLVIGYPPDATTTAPAGIQTGDPAGVTFGLAQTNLSSDTRPPAALAAGLAPAAGTTGMLNSAPEFVRLLWQASITRSGGYYLYYYDAGSGGGLPDRIFDDRGEAQVRLLVIYARRGPEADWDRVRDYMTAVITGDLIDTSASVVVATAAPDEPPLPGSEARDLTLAQIAERSYSGLGDLAAANRDVPLEPGRKLTVRHGVFQAPTQGITLASMLSQYPTTEAALNAANPAVPPNVPALSWPLYYPRAIYLPTMEVTVGASPHSATLGELAGHYRVALTRLAVDNANVTGLFKQDRPVTVPGGPVEATAIIPAGSAAVAARRTAPEVPDWKKPDYGLEFLRNTFSLLGYQAWDNGFFNQSNLGLPAGPVPPEEDVAAGADKVRLAAASDTWEYRQSVPYYRFAKSSGPVSPYQGVGKILQVNYGWQDYYGNTLRTTLDSPPSPSGGPLNRPPMLAGYTDQVLGLGQWPSASSAWSVLGQPSGERDPKFKIALTFDPSRYEGPIKATARGSRDILIDFTASLDRASAETVSNYVLDGGLQVASAVLYSAKSVQLRTSATLTSARYVLQVKGVKGTGDSPVYYGTLSFPGDGQPGPSSSAITEAAQLDLAAYTTLQHQLTDPLGVAVRITPSLTGQPFDLNAQELTSLNSWLFSGPVNVRSYLAARAAGNPTATTPGTCTIERNLVPGELPAGPITELTVDFTISRTGGVVLGELDTNSAIRSATTRIPALTKAAAGDPLGLGQFAADFEFALETANAARKVATGVNRLTASAPDPGAALWMVRVGRAAGQPISYSIGDAGDPRLFAPRPVCNKLVSRQHVQIRPYQTGTGLSGQPVKLSFADVDLDSWGRGLLDAVDDLLAPEFTAAMQIVGVRKGTNRLAELLAQKGLLAAAVSKLMIPLYKADKNVDPAFVQAVYQQQLLTELANAYDTKAGIQFSASVAAPGGGAGQPPMLFGAVRDAPPAGDLRRSDLTLTSPKLALSQNDAVPLPILLGAPETVTVDGAVAGSVDLTLTWKPSAIEHQIAPEQGLGTYTASSWLSFVIPDDSLDASLGTFAVPIVLRAFPASPALTDQAGEPAFAGATDLADLTKWRYEATWSLPFHYVQDRVHGVIEFNVAPGAVAAAAPDLFDALAQFTTVYPAIKADLDRYLAPIEATSSFGPEFDDADVALRSFVEVLAIVNAAAAGAAGLALDASGPTAAGAAGYGFEVYEGANSSGYLLVTLVSHGPAAVFEPAIDIPGYATEVFAEAPGLRRFIYQANGEYLTQAEGQQIPERTLVLPNLDVLQRQDAWATVWVTRNERILEDGPELADPFVYTTSEVKFSEPLLPSLESEHLIDIAAIGTGGSDRTLNEHLTALFRALFADVPPEVTEVLIGAEASYLYPVLAGADPVELPIFFQPLLPVVIAKPGDTLPDLTRDWSDLISFWRQSEQPVTAGARLHFDLTIFSSLTKNSMPLLRLRNLELAVADIRPS